MSSTWRNSQLIYRNMAPLRTGKLSPEALLRLLWNSPTFTTWGNFFIISIKSLTVIPLILNLFNTEEIALWLLFASIISFSSMLDMGFYSIFSRVISYAMGGATTIDHFNTGVNRKNLGEANWPLMREIYGVMGYIFLILGGIAFFLLASFGSISVAKTIAFSSNQLESWSAWAVLVISITVTVYGRKFRTALHGMNYIALMNRWSILLNLLGILLSIIVLLVIPSLLYVVIAMQLFVVLGIPFDRYLLMKFVEGKKFSGFSSFKWDSNIFSSVWSPTWRTAIALFASTGTIEITGIIYAQVAGPEKLTSYLLALRLMALITALSRAPFYSKMPRYAKLRAEAKLNELATLTKRSIKISLHVFIFGTLFVALFADKVLLLIKSNLDFVPLYLWLFMSNIFFLERHHSMHTQIFSTTNIIPFHITFTISGITNIALMLVLLPYFDYWAFPTAFGLSNLLINNWWNVSISIKSLEENVISYLRGSFIIPGITFVILQVLLFAII